MTQNTSRTITENDVSVELAARVLEKARALGTWHFKVLGTPYTIGPGPVARAIREIGNRTSKSFPHRDLEAGRRNRGPAEAHQGIEDYVEELEDRIEGLDSDLREAVRVAWDRGAHDWVRMNYPAWVPEAKPQNSSFSRAFFTIAFEAWQGQGCLEGLLDDEIQAQLSPSWSFEKLEPAHGFEVLSLTYAPGACGTEEDIVEAGQNELKSLLSLLGRKVENEDLFKIKAIFGIPDSHELLAVDFQYHDTKQICTASLPRKLWDKRDWIPLTNEELVMLAHQEIDVFEEYRASDITVTDAYESISRHPDPL